MKIATINSTTDSSRLKFRYLIICGVLSSLLYFGTDILASIQYRGYNYISQCFSELQAVGASTRPIIVITMSIYNLLIILFACGIIFNDKRKCAFITGLMLIEILTTRNRKK
jgi:hypothetical protein